MPRKLKLALIGLGRRGRSSHLPIYPRMNEVFDFVAVCDKDEEVLREVATEYGVNAYTSVRDLVDGEELDVVDVVVPGDAPTPSAATWPKTASTSSSKRPSPSPAP